MDWLPRLISGGEDLRRLHVFEENCLVTIENAFFSVGVYDCSFRIGD